MAERVRPERVAEEFREVLAEEIPRLKDPRIGFVTVTRVDVSPDLRRATVFYTVLGENRDHRATRAGLQSARTHLRSELGHQVRLIPPADVKPFVKRQKNDAIDAEAICEAALRPKHAVRCREERTATGGGFGISDS